MECGVCLDKKNENEFTTLPCNHQFCTTCISKIVVPKCPYCRAQYGNDNHKYYNEIDDEEFEFDFNIVYFSDDDELYESSRSRRRGRRRRHENPRPRPRQTTSAIPVNIFVIEPEENIENTENVIVNHRKKNPKYNERRKNNINNTWNHRRLQTNISQSY